MGQTPGSPSPTHLAGSRSPFQASYQGQQQQQQQNYPTRGQRDTQSQARGPRDIQPQPSHQGQQQQNLQQNYPTRGQKDAQAQPKGPKDIQPQPSYQGQQQQNYPTTDQRDTQSQARNQRNTQPQYQAQEPYHPPYERQTLVQQVRQQQQQGYQNISYHGEVQQQYINQGKQTPYQQDIQRKHGVAQQGLQHQQYHGQQAQPYQGQAQTMHQSPPRGDSYSNPKTVFFHMLFKGSAIIFYIFGGWITSSFVLQFVVIVLLSAFDFWTVKNVSGRILVGMRYWNESDESGKSLWRFESLDPQILDQLNKKDTMLFWTSLYATPAIWTLFGIVAALKLNFDYLMIVIIALSMSASNIIGFTKCKKDAKKKTQRFAQQAMGGFMREAMTASITNNISKVLNVL